MAETVDAGNVDKVNESLILGGNIELVGFKQVSLAEVLIRHGVPAVLDLCV